jgi:hypothetical protein
MKKPAVKRIAKTLSLQQYSNTEWDTVKAQLLEKISAALKPKKLDYNNYTTLFSIPWIIPKPGMPLTTPGEYTFLIEQAMKPKKPPIVNITITENPNESDGDKENEDDNGPDGGGSKSKGSKVRICVYAYQFLSLILVFVSPRKKHPPFIKPTLRRTRISRRYERNGSVRNQHLPAPALIATLIPKRMIMYL